MANQQILPFYGHHPRQEHCEFSNFYWQNDAFSFVIPEFACQSWTPREVQCHFSEKAIMALKASLFDDEETFWLIEKSQSPGEVKALGRKVKNFKDEIWMKHLKETALEVVYQKFKSSKRLKDVLLKTATKHIVEAAPGDRIWGVGIGKTDPRIWDPSQWQGRNVLGDALMETRKKLREDQGQPDESPAATEPGPQPKRSRWQKSDVSGTGGMGDQAGAKGGGKVTGHFKTKNAGKGYIQTATAPPTSAFDCYVVLDFEATCDKDREMETQEIIEFPLVLVDAKTLKQVDEFRTYVRPSFHPELTNFCKEFTGIQQEQVADAPLWPDARAIVETWLQDRMECLGYGNYIFVTCGDWDLKTMLPSQCKAYKEEVPASFQRWLNIKNFYAEATGERGKKKKDMVGMLKGLELELEGRHHCGLDDCRNIARILIELLKRGSVNEEMLTRK